LVGTLSAVGWGLVDDVQRETRRLQQAGPERARELESSERFGDLARDLRLAERTDRFLQDLPQRLRGGSTAEALRAAATRGVAFLVVQRSVERSTVRVGPFVTLAAGLVGIELSGVAGALLAVLAATIVVTGASELAGSELKEHPEPADRSQN